MGINTPLEKEKKHNLAVSQGDTYSLALDEMKDEDVSASLQIDDYIISLACENAEGMYMTDKEGRLSWMTPADKENIHVEVVVQDKDDKRFIPHLDIFCKLYDEDKKEVANLHIPFIWHPFLFHYGMNTTIPRKGKYTAEITIKKPLFHRHDQTYGMRYQKDVTILLGPLLLTPGRKDYGEE